MTICAGCGQLVTRPKSQYCSRPCTQRASHAKNPEAKRQATARGNAKVSAARIAANEGRTCEGCGAGLDPARRRSARYCSARCGNKAWFEAHPGYGTVKQARWREGNRERHREHSANAAHRRRQIVESPVAESFTALEIAERDRWVCGICSRAVDPLLRHPDPMARSLDHVVALARGGAHVRANAQLAHLVCNMRKGGRPAQNQAERR